MDLKKEIIKTSNAVRSKYIALKKGLDEEEEIVKKKFKPIIEPIREIVKDFKRIKKHNKHYSLKEDSDDLLKTKKNEYQDDSNENNTYSKNIEQDEEESIDETEDLLEEVDGDNIDIYIKKAVRDTKNEMDHTYGIYRGNDGWMIGNTSIKFLDGRTKIQIKDKVFKPTRGLLELLFKKKPLQKYITQKDLDDYKTILILSSAHLTRYTAGEKINGTKSPKYKQIISKIFKKGSGLNSSFMKVNLPPCTPEYAYYSDVNELVNRLRLLKASEAAGNNNHTNEIINIIDQLRTQGVIY